VQLRIEGRRGDATHRPHLEELVVKIVVLGGAGAMGQVICTDLAESAPVDQLVIADFDLQKAEELKNKLANKKVSATRADIRDTAQLTPALKGCDAVINSTPYYFNINVMEAALAAGCHYLDLGGLFHITRRQLELHSKFKESNLLAILGMGAAPGMTSIMAAHGAEQLDKVESIDIVIGCVDFAEVD